MAGTFIPGNVTIKQDGGKNGPVVTVRPVVTVGPQGETVHTYTGAAAADMLHAFGFGAGRGRGHSANLTGVFIGGHYSNHQSNSTDAIASDTRASITGSSASTASVTDTYIGSVAGILFYLTRLSLI